MTTYLGIRQQMFTHATGVGRSFAAFGGSCAPGTTNIDTITTMCRLRVKILRIPGSSVFLQPHTSAVINFRFACLFVCLYGTVI